MKLLGITGKAGSGKSTVAAMIEMPLGDGVEVISLAEPMKCALHATELFDAGTLWGSSEARSKVHPKYGISARQALQTLGTQWGRQMIHPDIWIDSLLKQCQRWGLVYVIPDVRFVNEARAIVEAGGQVWRLWRGGLKGEAGQHESEQDIFTGAMTQYVKEEIDNRDWEIAQLESHVRSLLILRGLA